MAPPWPPGRRLRRSMSSCARRDPTALPKKSLRATPPSLRESPIRSGIGWPSRGRTAVDGDERRGLRPRPKSTENEMDIRVSGHQIDTGEALRGQVDSRLHAIADKYFSRAISAQVTFGKGPY